MTTKRQTAAAGAKVREQVRVQLVLWLSHAHDVLADLQDQAERMRAELEAWPDSPLADFLELRQASEIAGALEEAISQVCTPIVPRSDDWPDPMGIVDAARLKGVKS